jgi:cytochrome c-type biogenesis protein CcmH
MRRVLALLAAAAALLAPATAVARPASLLDVEDEVMCVTCNVALNIAESPQADRQREFIREQIAQGKDKQQVKDALVAEYGEDVLGLPEDDGFGVTAYAIPIALMALLVGALAILVPRWRRGGRDDGGPAMSPAATGITAADAQRLDDELARYEA